MGGILRTIVGATAALAAVAGINAAAGAQEPENTEQAPSIPAQAPPNIEQPSIAEGVPAAPSVKPATVAGSASSPFLSTCERPERPVLATEPSAGGRVSWNARRRAAFQYNDHVKAANAYMACIAKSAEQDLSAYYAAVNQSLTAEQGAVMAELAKMRDELDKSGE